MIEQFISWIIENIELCATFLGLLFSEFVLLKLGKKDKAQKVKEKRNKLIKKLTKKHQKTQNKFIKEEQKLNELKKEN